MFKNFSKAFKKGSQNLLLRPNRKKKELKNLTFKISSQEILNQNDLIVIHTEWDEFRSLNFNKVKSKKIKIFDMRNLYQPNSFSNKKIVYYSIGRPANEKKA